MQVADLNETACREVVSECCWLIQLLCDAACTPLQHWLTPDVPWLSQAEAIRSAGGQAQAVTCDMCSYQQQRDLFASHVKAYGKLDYAILNAGIGEVGTPLLCDGRLCLCLSTDARCPCVLCLTARYSAGRAAPEGGR